ncbi:uncharacterized protein (TIGR00255 family) [Natronobacillus azotifigens]|uniref:YicC family protein n=1 Tax=Natronobacillus azotifigens TaxID=472978 RepID=A0A9J6RDH3_9BACI|nr:YicC/YloC family endoribonuclease [Natronobacillus azotifigens]MCZ0703372.1 YicC family protein [Natronobacillus azotifigens]
MANSMTGFGQHTVYVDQTSISVEVRTVNHRFFDLSLKIPRSFYVLEAKVKNILQSYFGRGRVEVYVTVEGQGLVERVVDVDWLLLDQYINHMTVIKEKYLDKHDLSVDILPNLEEIFIVTEVEKQTDQIKKAFIDAVNIACQQAEQMRQTEGSMLIEDILKRMKNIDKITNQLHDRRDTVIKDYHKRILDRLSNYTAEINQTSDPRIFQEVALLAEKGDISEEITRLHSHVEQFIDTANQVAPKEIGRKLEFILQEMLRETNTIGSKANDPQISNWVVDLKTEIEKIKEQIQNIE